MSLHFSIRYVNLIYVSSMLNLKHNEYIVFVYGGYYTTIIVHNYFANSTSIFKC